jgi:hypothetical protein
MKIFAAAGIAILALAPAALAQTRVMTAHDETAATLSCLLAHGKGCNHDFVARAGLSATPWLEWNASEDFEVGALQSWKYAGTESANAYTTKYLRGQPTDVYDVRFERRKLTFYIVPPGPDGKVRYMLIRWGEPDDERAEMWASNPLGRF